MKFNTIFILCLFVIFAGYGAYSIMDDIHKINQSMFYLGCIDSGKLTPAQCVEFKAKS